MQWAGWAMEALERAGASPLPQRTTWVQSEPRTAPYPANAPEPGGSMGWGFTSGELKPPGSSSQRRTLFESGTHEKHPETPAFLDTLLRGPLIGQRFLPLPAKFPDAQSLVLAHRHSPRKRQDQLQRKTPSGGPPRPEVREDSEGGSVRTSARGDRAGFSEAGEQPAEARRMGGNQSSHMCQTRVSMPFSTAPLGSFHCPGGKPNLMVLLFPKSPFHPHYEATVPPGTER